MQAHPPAEASASTGVRICANCGAGSTTRFCGECGRPLAAAPATTGLLRESVAEVLGVEHGILGTLRDQLIRPAKVYHAHLHGNPDGYVRPIKLFFLLAGAYMLLLSLVKPFTFDIGMLVNQPNPEWGQNISKLLAQKGITQAILNERMQSRMNTAAPLVVAFALLPMAALLKLMRRERPYREHVMFLLTFSNSIWLVSLLTLPLYRLAIMPATVLMQVVNYVYVGIGFFAFYRSTTRLRTSAKFAGYVVVDLVLTYTVSFLMLTGILLTILLM